jgi:DNA-binding response OmpR family regulator
VRREEIDTLLKAGADGFLPKPFSLAELTRRMSDLLGIEAAGTPATHHEDQSDRAAA